MTISKSLKKLFKTITGSDAKSNTAGDIINELNDNYPSTYVFDFDITESDSTISITPREGVTFEAIKSALAKTPNVYIKAHFADGSYKISLFNSEHENFVSCHFIMYNPNNTFSGVYTQITVDNRASIKIIPLASA